MKRAVCTSIAILLLCALLITTERPAEAQVPTQNQVIGIGVVIAAIGAGIGIGIYFLVRPAPSITGCTVSGATGLTLQNESDQQKFTLMGDTSALKAGDRVRVKGKKKKDASGNRTFLVDKLSRDYGVCKASLPNP